MLKLWWTALVAWITGARAAPPTPVQDFKRQARPPAAVKAPATTRPCPACRGTGRGPRTTSPRRPVCRECIGAGTVPR